MRSLIFEFSDDNIVCIQLFLPVCKDVGGRIMLKQIIKDRMWTGPIWLTATKLQDPYEAGNFMTRWATVRHGLCWCSSVPTRVLPSPVSRRREWSDRVVPWTACCGHRFPRELYGAPGNLCLSPNNKPAHKHEACQTAHQSPLKHKHHETDHGFSGCRIWKLNIAQLCGILSSS